MAKNKGTYKLVAKNSSYAYDPKTGKYGDTDFVLESEDLSDVLSEFLQYAQADEYAEDNIKVTLTFTYKNKNKK